MNQTVQRSLSTGNRRAVFLAACRLILATVSALGPITLMAQTIASAQMGADTKPAAGSQALRALPVSFVAGLASTVEVRLPAPDLTHVLKEDREADGKNNTARRVGIRRKLPAPVELGATKGTAAEWYDLSGGGRLWVATVESQEAVAMRVHFEDVSLPEGAWIQVYNAQDPQENRGPLDMQYLAGGREFWSPSVFGSEVEIECYCPPLQNAEAIRFRIREITHRYVKPRDLEGLLLKAAGACNNDATCSPAWQQIAQAVAGIGAVTANAEIFCTGCLLNDADPATYRDYFLTANHCVGNQVEATSSEFYWFYQTSSCNGPPPNLATVPRSIGGADYLAGATADQGNDFAFLRLRQQSPGGVTYAGWSTATPGSGETLTTIHHPDGDYKRISFGTRVGSTTDFWWLRWTSGTTEGGSSGSPLFNAGQQVIGQLYGGDSSCQNPMGTDDYGRFDRTYPLIQNWLLSLSVMVANDAFADASGIAGNSGTLEVSSAGATKEGGEPAHAGNAGGMSIWFRWTAPSGAPVAFDTEGSGFDTLLGLYTGSSVSSVVSVGANDDSQGKLTSRVVITPQAGTTYSIAVDGYDGSGGAVVLNWTTNTTTTGAFTNDNFASAQVLTGTRGFVRGDNYSATKEPGEPNHAGNLGGASVWFQWTAPSNMVLTVDTAGSDFDTLLAVYHDSSASGLTPVASNDDYGAVTSQASFTATAGTTYHIAVDGYNGGSGADEGSLILAWYGPPANDRFASAQAISETRGNVTGSNAGASKEPGEPSHAGSVGGRSVWYRWVAPVAGSVTFDTEGSSFDTLLGVYRGNSVGSLTTVASNDDLDYNNGVYQSRVTFAAALGTVYYIAVDGYEDSGYVESGFVLLTWYPPTPSGGAPSNDSFSSAQTLSGAGGSAAGSNLRATKESGEPLHADDPGGRSVWYRWTAPANGLATFDTTGSDFDTLLAAYQGSAVSSLAHITANDDLSTTTTVSRVTFPVTAGSEYHIAVDGLRTESGTIRAGTLQMAWTFLLSLGGNDMFANAQVLSGGMGNTYGSSVGATSEPDEPAHPDDPGGASVWYRWTAPANGPVTFDLLGSAFDTLLAVYTGSSLNSLNLVASNDDVELGRYQSLVKFDATSGKEYWIAVDGYGADSGSILLNWSQPLGTRPLLGIARSPGPHRFYLSVTGVAGVSYTIEYSTNLSSWTFLTNLPSSGTPIQFVDPGASSAPVRYYRAKATP